MRTYTIIDVASGGVTGSQTLDDPQAPVLLQGQRAVVSPVGYIVDTGTFSGTGADTSPTSLFGDFNITISGTFTATIVLERSFDAGSTWNSVTFADGTPLSFSGPASTEWEEVERGVLYRLKCTSYSSGTPAWRISQ